GAGARPALLGRRGDPGVARGQVRRCVRPRLGACAAAGPLAPQRRARRRDPRGCGGTRLARDLPVSKVREAMVPEPRTLEVSAPAVEAGELLARPEVRAIFVCDDGRLAGVLTRKTLVREVVARGLDPKVVTVGEIAEEPHYTIDSEMSL